MTVAVARYFTRGLTTLDSIRVTVGKRGLEDNGPLCMQLQIGFFCKRFRDPYHFWRTVEYSQASQRSPRIPGPGRGALLRPRLGRKLASILEAAAVRQ
jgi:hypothetical protein